MSAAARRANRRHSAKVFLLIVLSILFLISAGTWWFYFRSPAPLAVTRQEISKIELIAIPEGPGLVLARNPNTTQGQTQLHRALPNVPIPLPAPLRQGFWCKMGGLVRFTLIDGRVISYGPCRLPPEIQAFRASLFG